MVCKRISGLRIRVLRLYSHSLGIRRLITLLAARLVPVRLDFLKVQYLFAVGARAVLGSDMCQYVRRTPMARRRALCTIWIVRHVEQYFPIVFSAGKGVPVILCSRIIWILRGFYPFAFFQRGGRLGLERLKELGSFHLGQRHERLQVAVLRLRGLVPRALAQLGHELRAGALSARYIRSQLVDRRVEAPHSGRSVSWMSLVEPPAAIFTRPLMADSGIVNSDHSSGLCSSRTW